MIGDEFLDWFREATERAWSEYEPREFVDVGGLDWQRGTRWTGGLPDVDRVERETGFRFPPDHRRFLEVLHSTDRPMKGALFRGQDLVPAEGPGFYDWIRDGAAIARARAGVVDGLVFDVEHNRLWPESWGSRPRDPEDRRRRVEELVASAPRLLPIFQYRFVLECPPHAVLSVHQSDIIVYGETIESYLKNEFSRLLRLSRPFQPGEVVTGDIPFWGELIAG